MQIAPQKATDWHCPLLDNEAADAAAVKMRQQHLKKPYCCQNIAVSLEILAFKKCYFGVNVTKS